MCALIRDIFLPEMVFLRYGLLFALLSSCLVGIVGTVVVTRRISSIAGAISHSALGGVGIALYVQRVCAVSWCSPLLGAVIGAVIAAQVVGVVSLYAKEREDTIIAVVWATGMSLGLLFLHRTPGYVDWQGFLFGNILLITKESLWMTVILSVLTVVPTIFFYHGLLACSFDGTFAVLRGLRARLYYFLLLALTALTIVLLINVVGIILVISLLTLPAATAGCFTRHLWSTMVVASVLNCFFVTGGLLLSYFYQLPSGAVITILAGAVYLIGQFFALCCGRRI